MIKAYLFDLDDTFYDCYNLNEEGVEALCRYASDTLLHMDYDMVRGAFDAARFSVKEQITDDVAARHNRMLYMERMLEILKIPSVSFALELYDYFWNYILSHMVLYNGVKEFLQRLREDGILIGICTDMTVHIQHRKLRALGIAEYIDYITTSEEAGREKPDPVIFELALSKMGVRPEEVVYVGDSLRKDVEGPAEVGMTPIWYTDGQEQESDYLHAKNYMEMSRIYIEQFAHAAYN